MSNDTIVKCAEARPIAAEFRPVYKNDAETIARITRIKQEATPLLETVKLIPPSRERSVALTKLEESVMWAVKAASA